MLIEHSEGHFGETLLFSTESLDFNFFLSSFQGDNY